MFRHVDELFPVLLRTLPDDSDEVVQHALKVFAVIISSPAGKKLSSSGHYSLHGKWWFCEYSLHLSDVNIHCFVSGNFINIHCNVSDSFVNITALWQFYECSLHFKWWFCEYSLHLSDVNIHCFVSGNFVNIHCMVSDDFVNIHCT